MYLRDNATGKTARIGTFDGSLPGKENKMRLSPTGFSALGIPTLERCGEAESAFVSIDEIGYLDVQCPEYCRHVQRLMEKKRLIAVVRKQSLPFLQELCRREDIFIIDMDNPFGSFGCVIMASGLGRRFGRNKLMAEFQGKPMIHWSVEATEDIFAQRVVVTRHEDVAAYCREQGVAVLLHDLPHRSDTVRLGLETLGQDLDGCMFCPADQPLLRWDTPAALALCAVNGQAAIWRPSFADTPGSPVLFPKWAFPELLTLPEGKGGGFLAKKYPERVKTVPVRKEYELKDVDTPEDLAFLTACNRAGS